MHPSFSLVNPQKDAQEGCAKNKGNPDESVTISGRKEVELFGTTSLKKTRPWLVGDFVLWSHNPHVYGQLVRLNNIS